MEVDGANDICNRFKRGQVRRTEKCGRKVTRLQYSLDAKASPFVGEIWKQDLPFFALAIVIAFANEALDAVEFASLTFVVFLALVFTGDLFFQLEERQKKHILLGSKIKVDRLF